MSKPIDQVDSERCQPLFIFLFALLIVGGCTRNVDRKRQIDEVQYFELANLINFSHVEHSEIDSVLSEKVKEIAK
ncbi:MAG: hypothetical protein CSA03_00985 [Bacteroidetes bacterium]|nr:MAG: hypothetical protein CSA03_00985 [Bacteroidota bacterium]